MGSLSLTTSQNLNQSGFSGYGSLLTVSKDSDDEFPGSFMGALMQISAVNVRTNVIPSSHMTSKGRFQSFSPGLRDGGDIAAAVNWLPGANDTQARYAADWSLLRQATLESNELTRIRVFAPDPDLHMISMRGFLTQLGPFSYAPEAIMSGQVGWKIVGAPDVITPLVYDVSGTSYGTVALNDISKAGASESGSKGTTIKLGRKNVVGGIVSELVSSVEASPVPTTTTFTVPDGDADKFAVGDEVTVAEKGTRTISAIASELITVSTAFGTAPAADDIVVVVKDRALPYITYTAKTATVGANYAVRLHGIDDDVDVHSDGVGDAWIRLFIPGIYELWLPHGTHTDDVFRIGAAGGTIVGGNDTTDRGAFHAAYAANGNKCFLAIYGSDEQL